MTDKSTVYHPTFPDVARVVGSKAAREAHKAAGWRMTPAGDEHREAAEQAAEADPVTD